MSYGYDTWANLLTATGTLPGCSVNTLSLSVNPNNQITNTGFSYDASGNVTQDGVGGSQYAWNAESQIKTAAGVTYLYDGDGNRVKKSNGKLYWYGAGSEILDESDLSGTITDEYVFFGGYKRCFGGGDVLVIEWKSDSIGDFFVHVRVLKIPKR